MKQNIINGKQAIIILHEIYGVNDFIKDQFLKYTEVGYDVFTPNMINKHPFSYDESEDAYNYFNKNIGFDIYEEISALVNRLKEKYNKVFILGFSVGATIAWRCCENSLCSGIVACYGSRIRDYTALNPTCPTLLLFAKENSFDVSVLINQLQGKEYLSMIEFDAGHGFIDPHSNHYDILQSKRAEDSIIRFINEYAK